VIHAVGADQAPLLASLHARAFAKAWSAAEVAKMMDNHAVFAVVSQEHDAPEGFAMAWAAAGDCELLTIAVVPEAQRRGLGAALVQAAAATALSRGAASMHLEVAEDNAAARALYAKLGFEPAGRRPAYYATDHGRIDAIVMRLTLG